MRGRSARFAIGISVQNALTHLRAQRLVSIPLLDWPHRAPWMRPECAAQLQQRQEEPKYRGMMEAR